MADSKGSIPITVRVEATTKAMLQILSTVTGQTSREIVERALIHEFGQMKSDGGHALAEALDAVLKCREKSR